jgi:hypothetical protein
VFVEATKMSSLLVNSRTPLWITKRNESRLQKQKTSHQWMISTVEVDCL